MPAPWLRLSGGPHSETLFQRGLHFQVKTKKLGLCGWPAEQRVPLFEDMDSAWKEEKFPDDSSSHVPDHMQPAGIG